MAIFLGHNSGHLIKKEIGFYAGVFTTALFPILALLIIFYFNQSRDFKALGLLIVVAIFVPILRVTLKTYQKKAGQYFRGRWGEHQIKHELLKLPDEFVVFQDVQLNRGNVDFVVISPENIFAVEAKSHSGTIGFNGQSLTLNSRNFKKDFLKQAFGQALGLKDFLQTSVQKKVFIQPVIVFSGFVQMAFGFNPLKGVFVVSKLNLNSLLKAHLPPSVKFSQIEIVRALKTLYT